MSQDENKDHPKLTEIPKSIAEKVVKETKKLTSESDSDKQSREARTERELISRNHLKLAELVFKFLAFSITTFMILAIFSPASLELAMSLYTLIVGLVGGYLVKTIEDRSRGQ